MLEDRYKILGKLNQGSFGKIHKGIDTETGRFVAIKVETGKLKGLLKQEVQIYRKFSECMISPTLKWPAVHAFAVLPTGANLMIMDLLGPDLDCVLKKSPQRRLPSYKVGYLAYKMIHVLRIFHQRGFVHRDIKPQNFVLEYYEGKCPKFPEVFLVDYGLAKRYLNADKTHARFALKCGLGGTVRYVSANTHLGLEPSRRDDLQSLAYVLIYLALGQLPWQHRKEHRGRDKDDVNREVMVLKMRTTTENLCERLIEPLRTATMQFLFYVESLMYHEEPDYAYCQELFAVLHNNFLGFNS